MLSVVTIHGFRGNIKENNLKNSTINMLKIQPYIDAIWLKYKGKVRQMNRVTITKKFDKGMIVFSTTHIKCDKVTFKHFLVNVKELLNYGVQVYYKEKFSIRVEYRSKASFYSYVFG